MINTVILNMEHSSKVSLLREHKDCMCLTLRVQFVEGEAIMNFNDEESVRQFATMLLTLLKDQPELRHEGKT